MAIRCKELLALFIAEIIYSDHILLYRKDSNGVEPFL
jgi:hypothetical protein